MIDKILNNEIVFDVIQKTSGNFRYNSSSVYKTSDSGCRQEENE